MRGPSDLEAAADSPVASQAFLENEFREFQISASCKFSVIAVFANAVYIIVYFLRFGSGANRFNSLPAVGAGTSILLFICALALHYKRRLTQVTVTHAVGLSFCSAFSAIAHPEVQFYLSHSTKLLEPVGRPPACGFSRAGRCWMEEAYLSTMLLQLMMTYYIVFLLRFRIAVIVSVPSVAMYLGMVLYFGSYSLTGRVFEYPIFTLSIALVLVVKFTIEASQRQLFLEVQCKRMEVVQEKVLRCQAEFRTAHLQVCVDRSAEEGDVLQSNKTDAGKSSSAGVFVDDIDDTMDTLQKIRAFGHREHWLLDVNSVIVSQKPILGCGGYGLVLRGYFGGAPVALKLAKRSRDEQGCRQLLSIVNELRILRRLRHPNIVLFHGACIDFSENVLVLVLELVAGETLEKWIRCGSANSDIVGGHPLKDEPAKTAVLLGVTNALSYLHRQDPCIVHGDVKASNIMVEELASQPRAKLLDFGLSRLLTPSAKPLGGTLAWLAPEVVRGRSKPTSCSDVFSFGRLLYFVAASKIPFADFRAKPLRRLLRLNTSPQLVWPLDPFSHKCRSIAEGCMHPEQDSRPPMHAVHNSIFRWDLPSDCAPRMHCEINDDDSAALCKFIKYWHHSEQQKQELQGVIGHGKAQVKVSSPLALAMHAENIVGLSPVPVIREDEVRDVAAATMDKRGSHVKQLLKPTQLHTKVLALSEMLATWYDEPSSLVSCCPLHKSLRGLEEVVNVMKKKCVSDFGCCSEDYQCPRCLLVADPVGGVCTFCNLQVGSVDDRSRLETIEPHETLKL